jgi:hypothetical protein
LEERELAQKNNLTFETARIRGQATRMKQNLERALLFLGNAREEMSVQTKRRRKEIAKALATSYSFDGRNKSIEINIHPLLKELVTFARDMGRIEPPESSSHKQKEPAFIKPVLFGGP